MYCKSCKTDKDINDFYPHLSKCKDCRKSYQKSISKKVKPESYKPSVRTRKIDKDKYLTLDEFNMFKKCITNDKMDLFWRLLASTGLRIREGLNIKKSDLNYDRLSFNTNTLKRKDKPIHEIKIAESMWLRIKKRCEDVKEDYLFSFSYEYDLLDFKSTCARAKLNPRFSPHSLRHLYGTYIFGEYNNLIVARDALRHTSTKMTERYVRIPDKAKQEQANKMGTMLGD